MKRLVIWFLIALAVMLLLKGVEVARGETRFQECEKRCTFDGELNVSCFLGCVDTGIDIPPQPKQKCRWEYGYFDLCDDLPALQCNGNHKVKKLNKILRDGWELQSDDALYLGSRHVYLRRQVCD